MSDDLFLPEPVPREVKYTVISVDDHVVEPAHTFEGRLPATLQDRAPRIVETPEGYQVWEFEGARYTQVGMNAVAGLERWSAAAVEPGPEAIAEARSIRRRFGPSRTRKRPGTRSTSIT